MGRELQRRLLSRPARSSLLLCAVGASCAAAQPCELSSPTPIVPASAPTGALFGASLAADAGTLVIGAPGDPAAGINAGAVHITSCTTLGCAQTQRITGPTTGLFDQLGAAVAISGSIIIAGAPSGDPLGVRTGSATVFERDGGVWSATATLIPSTLGAFAGAGTAVAVHGSTAVVSAPGDTATGSVFVFARSSNGSWTQSARLVPTQPGTGFGAAVALEGDLLAVGAPTAAPGGIASGAVMLYRAQGGQWLPEATLAPPDPDAGDRFGDAIAIAQGAVIVGAPQDDALGPDTGAAFVYRLTPEGWQHEDTLHHPSPQPNDRFGAALDTNGNAAAVGTDRPFTRSDTTLFRGVAGVWNHEATLTLPTAQQTDAYACGIALDADLVFVGARGTNTNAGATLRFDLDACGPACPADVNGDGFANPSDFGAWVAAYNGSNPAADQNGDGLVTPSDFGAWIANYNAGC